MRPIAITVGDPAGIGPEIALKAVRDPEVLACCAPVLVGHRALLARVADRLGLSVPDVVVEPALRLDAASIEPGIVSAAAGAAGAAAVELAIDGCRDGRFAAMVTCPLNKRALAMAGVPFPGHTELLAARCGVRGEVMMLYDEAIAVALVTVHQGLATVAAALEPARIVATGRLLAQALARLRGRPARLAVLGFNPHAGEGGLFGDEERAIAPAVYELLQLGIDAEGPLPPDTAFTPANRERFDGYVCMYHDQGLIPFKALAFAEGVNVTLGLPITRTSVDHGTAFDIAWQGVADHRNLVAAIRLAARLAT
ncbi:MAG TPA: 4-hydroxythreonine-4-phosphate dehydrogenase PdxA [Planctomycetota bacterium]|nr:4-hydroxythreonine-4-phosphate dehydrogenase PdxA [Planctomycetota bacterium]